MKLQALSNSELLRTTSLVAAREREITLEIVARLREIDRRKAFVDLGYESLRDYLVKELKYSEAAAQRRMDAFRVLGDDPSLASDVASGSLNLTTVSRVQTFVRQQKISKGDRLALFQSMRGKSTREVEVALKTIAPEAPAPDRERVISADQVELRIVLSRQQLDQLKRVRSLLAHRVSSYAELLEALATLGLKELDPAKEPSRKVAPKTPAPVAVKESRHVPAAIQRQVWRDSEGRCSYRDPRTRRRCASTHALQIDHVWPYAWGGSSSDPKNLRLLCA